MLRKVNSYSAQRIVYSLKDPLLCLLSAVLLILSFPGFNLEFLAWVAFVPLFFALRDKTGKRAFWFSYFTGVIFWLGAIYWLIHVTPVGMILLVLYLALYFGIFGLFVYTKNYELRTENLIYISCVWVILEYLRSYLFTGFPWALLGYAQYLNLPFIQIADVTGVWGVSFLVMMANVWVYLVFSSWFVVHRIKIKYIFFFPVTLSIILGYGAYKLYYEPSTMNHAPIKISVIQGNIPQELKWDRLSADPIVDRYIALTGQAVYGNPDLIIWPEAAVPAVLEEEPHYFDKICGFVNKIKIPVLLGAVTMGDNTYFNSALLISASGARLYPQYNKIHLVPFGEYIPLKNIFRFLETVAPIGDIAKGRDYTIFEIPNSATRIGGLAESFGEPKSQIQNRFSVLICFEDLFPELSRRFVNKGAGFLVNITNDAWYKKTAAAEQHLQASVFRAVENRVFLVRSANTGVSGFIAPNGKIISLVGSNSGEKIFVPGYNTQEINVAKNRISLYGRYGDFFIYLLIFYIIYSIFLNLLKRAARNHKII